MTQGEQKPRVTDWPVQRGSIGSDVHDIMGGFNHTLPAKHRRGPWADLSPRHYPEGDTNGPKAPRAIDWWKRRNGGEDISPF